jgi:hypothetical protein
VADVDPPAVPDRLVREHHRALAAGVSLIFTDVKLGQGPGRLDVGE